jgi:hypothetical protein
MAGKAANNRGTMPTPKPRGGGKKSGPMATPKTRGDSKKPPTPKTR